jgi:hypothetical protein
MSHIVQYYRNYEDKTNINVFKDRIKLSKYENKKARVLLNLDSGSRPSTIVKISTALSLVANTNTKYAVEAIKVLSYLSNIGIRTLRLKELQNRGDTQPTFEDINKIVENEKILTRFSETKFSEWQKSENPMLQICAIYLIFILFLDAWQIGYADFIG